MHNRLDPLELVHLSCRSSISMSWLRLALRDSRLLKGKDPLDEKFLVRIACLDDYQEDFPVTKKTTFADLADALGPSNLVLFRCMGGSYEAIFEAGSVYSTLLQWKRGGDEHPTIVAPVYRRSVRPDRDVLAAQTIDRKQCWEVCIKRPDNDDDQVNITSRTTAMELARHLSVTRCIGIFSATRTADANRFSHYELLDHDTNISLLLSEWARSGRTDKMIVVPFRRFGGSRDDDGEPSNVADLDAEPLGEGEGAALAYYTCGSCDAEFAEGAGSGGEKAAEHEEDDKTVPTSPAAKAVPAPRTPYFEGRVPQLKLSDSTDSDVSDETVLPTFEELSLRGDEPAVAEVCGVMPSDPVYEVSADPAEIAKLAAKVVSRPVMDGLQQFRLGYIRAHRNASVEQTVHAFIAETIRLAGKEDQLRLRRISEEEIYAALLLGEEADAQQQRDLVQLDVPLLACTAVSNVLAPSRVEFLHERAAHSLDDLPEARGKLKAGQREYLPAASAEARALGEMFNPVHVVLSVSEQASLETPAPAPRPASVVAAMRAKFERMALGSSPSVPPLNTHDLDVPTPSERGERPALPANAIAFADKLTAVQEVPADIKRDLVAKGLLVEGKWSSRIVLTVRGGNYHLRRWITRPATSLTEVLHYIALAVLCPGKELRDLLLEADRANGGEVSVHFDECKEGYKLVLERLEVLGERARIADEQEQEENRKYPPVFDGKIEIA